VARTKKGFIEHLEQALTLTADYAYLQQLKQTARENTWEARIEQILHALEAHQNIELSK